GSSSSSSTGSSRSASRRGTRPGEPRGLSTSGASWRGWAWCFCWGPGGPVAYNEPDMKRTPARVRIDRMLVDKGLVESREKAARHILGGDVFVDGERVDKAGALVASGAEVELRGRAPFVSRGGEKLVHAIDHVQIKVPGR